MNFIIFLLIINFMIIYNYEKISNIINIFDHPDQYRKSHLKKTPLIGGIFIYVNFLIYFIFIVFFQNYYDDYKDLILFTKSSFNNLFLFSTLIFLVGLYDDKKNLNASLKFSIFIILVYYLLTLNNELIIEYIYFSSLNYTIFLHNFSIFFTVLCFLLFINASNMFDGMDLQLGPYFIFIFILFFTELELNLLSLVFLISLFSFCFLNFNSKVFIGNSGAYFISFLIAYIFILQNNLNMKISVEEIFLIMSIPGLDMFRVFLHRLVKKKNPFSGDRNHLHHYLMQKYSLRISQILLLIINIAPFFAYQIFESIIIFGITVLFYFLLYFYLIINNRE
jgi:UDP-GlcNAc:undecaprenyl-phosphate/decaprenyl-phosphate GlcNAc-1-phosphate transferase